MEQSDNKKTIVEQLRDYFESLSPEELEEHREHFRKAIEANKKPPGWISIEEHLPMFLAKDIMQGYSIYKVKNKDGEEFETSVSDHNTWYYLAKANGITHWLNDK